MSHTSEDIEIDAGIARQATSSIVIAMVIACLTTIALWNHLDNGIPDNGILDKRLTYWLAALLGLSVLRLLISHLPALGRIKKRMQLPLTLATGLIWGASAPLFLPSLDAHHEMLLILVLVGIVAGSSNSYAGRMSLFYAFMLPILIPLGIWLFAQGEHIYTTLGIIVLLYMLALSTYTMRNTKLLKNSILKNNQLSHEIALREAHEQKLEAAHQQQAELALAIEHSSDLIYTYNLDGVVISANLASKTTFGGEVIGKNIAEIVAPDHLQLALDQMRHKLETGNNTIYELDVIDSEGKRHHLEINSSLMMRDGKPVAIHGIARDITKRKQAEKKLALLVQAIDASHEAIMVLDAEGVIEFANPAAGFLYHQPTNQIIGQQAAVLRGGKTGDDTYREIIASITNGKIWCGEILFHPDADHERLVARRVSPIMDEEGHVHHQICIDRDITEAKQHSQQLEHTQRLESLGILAGGIAHDFNNMLTAIMGNAAMAERGMDTDGDIRMPLSRIRQSSQRAADLCKQMLAYSGKGHFIIQPINIPELIGEMTRLMEVSIGKQITLRYDLNEDLPLIEGDSAQIQQVILNLITNANEAIGEANGEIAFSTGIMQAGRSYLNATLTNEKLPKGKYIYIEVADSGCGMDKKTIEKMFDPFFTTKFTGRGLGMSAVLGIVRGHHGAIRVKSQPGKGTSFRILLPVSDIKSSPPPIAEAEPEHTSHCKGSVLIVDDESLIREVASAMLKDIGFDIIEAADGEEAVALYCQHQSIIRAVLLDMTMPKMDGKTCFTELKKINPDVRVLLSSGYSEQDINKLFAEHTPAGFIQKPYMPKALQQKMEEILS